MLFLRITVLEFSVLLQDSIALYCALPDTGQHLEDFVSMAKKIYKQNIYIDMSNNIDKNPRLSGIC